MTEISLAFALLMAVYVVLLHVKLYAATKKPPTPPAPQPSEELTEFLADFKHHGYSFVRVDPSNVFMRSPRD